MSIRRSFSPAGPRSPGDHDRAGTGVAPFRGFLQERQVTAARGRNWLVFGNPRRRTDFLFEDELTAWHRGGLLTRLDTAFSRDQEHKIYVQHRLLESAAELWAWLEDGAHLYVCGDAGHMARDVDKGLLYIVAKRGPHGAGRGQGLSRAPRRRGPLSEGRLLKAMSGAPPAARRPVIPPPVIPTEECACLLRPSTSSPGRPSPRQNFCTARRSASRSAR